MVIKSAFFAFGLVLAMMIAGTARGAEVAGKVTEQKWTFGGIFGYYDRGQLQRGFQIVKENCASCHSLEYVAFRNLGEPGGPEFSPEEVKALAAEVSIIDGPDEAGDMFERPGLPSDLMPPPFANDNAARSANGGAMPPDLSVVTKSRTYKRGFPNWLFDLFTGYQEQGADYLYALLVGYEEEVPDGMELLDGLSYNTVFPGHQIAMPAPLFEDGVEYNDGTEASVDQMARDVSAFLMWAAEPHLEARKRMGFQVIIFLIIFASLLYATKRKIWSRVKH